MLLKYLAITILYSLLTISFGIVLLAICMNMGSAYTFGLARANEMGIVVVYFSKCISDLFYLKQFVWKKQNRNR